MMVFYRDGPTLHRLYSAPSHSTCMLSLTNLGARNDKGFKIIKAINHPS